MIKKSMIVTLALALVLALAMTAFLPALPASAASLDGKGGPGGAPGEPGRPNGQPGYPGGVPLNPLTAEEQAGLQSAILEEYGALNLYNTVISQLGSVSPFDRIASAEQQHINALVRQADKYGVAVPENPGLASAPVFTDLAAACQAGAAAEIADAALYDELELVTTNASLLRVYDRLQSASLNDHLPALQACD
jgi:hypothetical protein